MRTTPIHVHCGHCHEDFDEQAVNILDVEANELEQDVVLFKCPKCGGRRTSLRR